MTTTVNRDVGPLLALITCAMCHGDLAARADALQCERCGHVFPLHEGVPELTGDGVQRAEPSWAARAQYAVLSSPRLYDLHQALGGARVIASRARAALQGAGDATILDIGAGTGMLADLVPDTARYVWFDNDTLKLRGLLARATACHAVLGDAARLPFRDDAVDWTVMIDVSHHLPEPALQECFTEIARVTRDRFLFVDALRGPRLASTLLWQLDLGRHPRGEAELLEAIHRHFEVEHVDRFRINHDYVLCVCRPRDTSPT